MFSVRNVQFEKLEYEPLVQSLVEMARERKLSYIEDRFEDLFEGYSGAFREEEVVACAIYACLELKNLKPVYRLMRLMYFNCFIFVNNFTLLERAIILNKSSKDIELLMKRGMNPNVRCGAVTVACEEILERKQKEKGVKKMIEIICHLVRRVQNFNSQNVKLCVLVGVVFESSMTSKERSSFKDCERKSLEWRTCAKVLSSILEEPLEDNSYTTVGICLQLPLREQAFHLHRENVIETLQTKAKQTMHKDFLIDEIKAAQLFLMDHNFLSLKMRKEWNLSAECSGFIMEYLSLQDIRRLCLAFK